MKLTIKISAEMLVVKAHFKWSQYSSTENDNTILKMPLVSLKHLFLYPYRTSKKSHSVIAFDNPNFRHGHFEIKT